MGAGLLGCKAPFRLVQDHSRSGRLEASSLALRKWLFSDAFDAYLNLLQVRHREFPKQGSVAVRLVWGWPSYQCCLELVLQEQQGSNLKVQLKAEGH